MDLRTITVVGAGTMGAGIAQTAAQAGYTTRLYDSADGAVARGMERIQAFWKKGINKGKTTPEQVATWSASLLPTDDLTAAVAESDLVIEAVFEDLDLKRRIFQDLDAAAPEHAILATNTSSLSVTAIAAATRRPEQVLGMHFFNPVPLMKLLELVRHDRTADTTLDAARSVGARMGKTSITVRDVPGFATSRLGIILGNEAARMVEERVASVEDIDTAMRLGYGHPMGPLELSDLVGLDVRHNITLYLRSTLGGARWDPPAITERLVAAGDLGQKTGKGFYDWTSGTKRPRDDLLGLLEAKA